MAKQHLLMLGLVLTGSSLFAACSSDSISINAGGGDAGASEAGANSTAGKGNGEGGEAGSNAGAGGEAGAVDTTPTGPLNPQTVIVPAPAPATLNNVLVAGTDFTTSSEVASVALAGGAVTKGDVYQDGDIVTASSAGVGFVLERTNDKLHIIEKGKSTTTVDLTEAGTATAAIDNKAYVPFLSSSSIAIVDLGEGSVSRRIDLSRYDVPGDKDKSVDLAGGLYDPNQKIVYFMLQRIDRTTSVSPKFQIACSAKPSLIVGIDPATDEEVDLNGAAAGKAVELTLANPTSISINADGTALYVLNAGCYTAGKLGKQGLEVVDTSDGTTMVAYAPTSSDFLASLILTTGSEALLDTFDADGAEHWNTLDIAGGKLVGTELLNVPEAVSYDGLDLIGVSVDKNVGSVVRYAIATGLVTPISTSSWVGDYSAASATSLVE
jgi:hypothetical protein